MFWIQSRKPNDNAMRRIVRPEGLFGRTFKLELSASVEHRDGVWLQNQLGV
jgi:hypothetical protein